MKIIRLEADRIKVFLSERDLSDMHIDASSLSPDSPELSLFLCEVLDAVKAETGFSAEQGQIIAEATNNGDGIELMLSHVKKAPSKGRGSQRSGYTTFEFSGFDSLCGMLINVAPPYLAAMRLYTYRDRFYLAVPRRKIPALVYEYSIKNHRTSPAESFLGEHGKLLADGYRLLCMSFALKKMN